MGIGAKRSIEQMYIIWCLDAKTHGVLSLRFLESKGGHKNITMIVSAFLFPKGSKFGRAQVDHVFRFKDFSIKK